MAGAVWLAGLLVCAAVPGLLATDDPLRQDVTLTRLLEGPSWGHWLGTDRYGRDLWSRAVWGTRPALAAVVIGTGVSAGIGVPVGLVSGWAGGRLDRAVMWVVDVVFALPLVLVAMAAVTVTGTGLAPAMAAVGLLLSTRFARLARGAVLAEREALYVDAALVTGLRSRAVLGRYLLPNVAPAVIVQTAVVAGAVLLISAVLSFVGVGSAPDSYDWGAMLDQARRDFLTATWQIVPPTAAVVGTVLAFNLVGDALRDTIAHDQPRPGPRSRTGAWGRGAERDRRRHPVSAGAGGAGTAAQPPSTGVVLSVQDLTVAFPGPDDGEVVVVDRLSLEARAGETLGVVGESGSGKSVTVLAALGLVPSPGRVTGGSVWFGGRDATSFSERDWRAVRGNDIGVVWQDPTGSLNPALTVGAQVAEPLIVHQRMGRRQARARAVELLATAGLGDPGRVAAAYPHQLSGGMAQRAGIAAALACGPDLLIADEPTTALDVTVQAQVLDLLADLKEQLGMTMVIVTHDLGVIADTADRVAVVYAGQVVETATTTELFAQPRHPYTWSLLQAAPHNNTRRRSLTVIDGTVPVPGQWPTGCRFAPRCGFAVPACTTSPPALTSPGPGRTTRCARIDDLATTLDRHPPSPGPGNEPGGTKDKEEPHG